MRNLDLTALRSFVAVADTGGVTRAANLLNLTQSAVSMQMRRLEEALDMTLLERAGRGIALTAAGEQLLGHARRMLELNDDIVTRLTEAGHEGQLALGVPHDIVYPHIPRILQRFHGEFPRMKVTLLSSYTRRLLEQFGRGECDVTLTTEDGCGEGGRTLATAPLVWLGAPGGTAWRSRPLRLAFEPACMFRAPVLQALQAAGIPWEMAVESDSSRTIEASLSADLAIGAVMAGTAPPHLAEVAHGGTLPDLPVKRINMYVAAAGDSIPRARLVELIQTMFAGEAHAADTAA